MQVKNGFVCITNRLEASSCSIFFIMFAASYFKCCMYVISQKVIACKYPNKYYVTLKFYIIPYVPRSCDFKGSIHFVINPL